MLEGVAMSLLVGKYFPRELYEVLKALGESELTTMEAKSVAGVSHTFLLNVLPSLESGGFVSVSEGKTDKRKKLLRLTDGGKLLLDVLEVYRVTLEGNYPLAKRLLNARPQKRRRGKTP